VRVRMNNARPISMHAQCFCVCQDADPSIRLRSNRHRHRDMYRSTRDASPPPSLIKDLGSIAPPLRAQRTSHRTRTARRHSSLDLRDVVVVLDRLALFAVCDELGEGLSEGFACLEGETRVGGVGEGEKGVEGVGVC
jgi:hypothetical protein